MFIVEIITRSGKVCERFRSYEQARSRIMQLPADQIIGIPFIFAELPDGSQRLVREDGKPLQWHRLPEEADREEADKQVDERPLPLVEGLDTQSPTGC
jgi:hypothetical protein